MPDERICADFFKSEKFVKNVIICLEPKNFAWSQKLLPGAKKLFTFEEIRDDDLERQLML